HWASGLGGPGIMVMPTGTGKTETVLALLVAARMERLLVLVPSAALRDQIAAKFETLGILQQEQIVKAGALRPRVGLFEHGFKDADEAARFVAACNAVVATPQILGRSVGNVRMALLSSFSHLIVDEAHHSPADTWARVVDGFSDQPVLLFTATPFREDGRRLPGRTVFRFPLREAQRLEYFTHINYRAVFGVEDVDRGLAELAVGRLPIPPRHHPPKPPEPSYGPAHPTPHSPHTGTAKAMTASNQPASRTTTSAWSPHDSDHNPVLHPLPGHPLRDSADAHPLPPHHPLTPVLSRVQLFQTLVLDPTGRV
ncbi:DEAD/DEAH box helicase family protein, partial [Streptomyces sp. NPDC055078]